MTGKVFLYFLVIGMACIVFFNLQSGNLLYEFGQVNWTYPQEYYLRHQGYARLLSITGLVFLAIVRNSYVFWSTCIAFVGAVFLIGARSELAGILLVLPILIFYQWRGNPGKTKLIMVAGIILTSVMASIYWEELNMSRQMKLFNPGESVSFQNRNKLNSEVLTAIKENPIVGEFSGHVRNRKGVGAYAHNILSSWRQLGLIGFILYTGLVIWPVIGLITLIREKPGLLDVDVFRITFPVTVFMLFLAVLAKSLFSSVFALGWGLYVACLMYSSEELSSKVTRHKM